MKVCTLLMYATSEDKLYGQLRNEWIQILDPAFIDVSASFPSPPLPSLLALGPECLTL